jgi:1-acyl-sn-glycerol-3-phosphate acyltransferase
MPVEEPPRVYPTPEAPEPQPERKPAVELEWAHWSPPSRRLQKITRFLLWCLTRLEVQGVENFPAEGPVLMAVNHLFMLDVPIYFAVVPRRPVVFVGHNWERVPLLNRYLERALTAIWVNREIADRQALRQATRALKAGCLFCMAPEGTISQTGGLIQGKSGAAYLATRTSATIVPLVAYGQEKAFHYWKRLRRVPISVRVGSAYRLPAGKADTAALEQHTETIMLSLAKLLPPEYRGVYAGQTDDET